MLKIKLKSRAKLWLSPSHQKFKFEIYVKQSVGLKCNFEMK